MFRRNCSLGLNQVFLCLTLLSAFFITAGNSFASEGHDVEIEFWKNPTLLVGMAPDEEPPGEAAEEKEGPCLPLHTIEGNGGHFSVMTAYLTNPAAKGEIFGDPSVGFIHVDLNHGKHLQAFTITETLWDCVEIGYAYDNLDVGDLFEDIEAAGLGRPEGHNVRLHNFNLRYMLLKEGDSMPAITAGVHFKYNPDIREIDSDSGFGVMRPFRALGIKHAEGWDFTLMASKMLTDLLPRPCIISGGVRSTDAAHIGLLGFTGHRKIVAEAAICGFISDQIVYAAEYRQKPDQYDDVPGLLEPEDNWWALALGYIVNNDCSVALGYGHFGQLVNHTANRALGLAVKYEF